MPKKIKPKIKLKINEKAFNDFITHIETRFDNKKTISNYISFTRTMLNAINKNYKKITNKDIDKWLSNKHPPTAEVYKPVIKRFFEFHNLKKISDKIYTNSRVLTKQTRNSESVLNKDEIEKIINASDDLLDRALIETYITTGARRNEIMKLTINDIRREKDVTWVNIRFPKGETKPREIPIIPNPDNPVARHPKNLINWLEANKHKPPNSILFYSRHHKRKGETLSDTGIRNIINRARKNTDIDKKRIITPHIFRHTSASYDGYQLTERELCDKYGWIYGSPMPRRYCHKNKDALANSMRKLAGITKEETKHGKICPRCGEENELHAEICSKCQLILDFEKLNKELEEKQNNENEILKRIRALEEELNGYKEFVTKETDFIGTHYKHNGVTIGVRWNEENTRPIMEKLNQFEKTLKDKNIQWDKIEYDTKTNTCKAFKRNKNGKLEKLQSIK